MRYGTATSTMTAKCEGCGMRLTHDKLYWYGAADEGWLERGAWGNQARYFITVCSLPCHRVAQLRQYQQEHGG